MQKYEAKPKIVWAEQYDGTNLDKIHEFVGTNLLSLKGINMLKPGDFVVNKEGIFEVCSAEIFNKNYTEV